MEVFVEREGEMKIACKYCSTSGKYIGFAGSLDYSTAKFKELIVHHTAEEEGK